MITLTVAFGAGVLCTLIFVGHSVFSLKSNFEELTKSAAENENELGNISERVAVLEGGRKA